MWFAILLAGCVGGPGQVEPEIEPVWVGPEGGTLVFGDASIVVPDGALSEPVELFLYETDEPLPSGYDGLSKLWRAEPEGLVFQTPVIMRLPYTPADTADPLLIWSDGEGGYSRRTSFDADDGGLVRAYIDQLSAGFVATLSTGVVEEPSPYPPADMLFVVDSSFSMIEEQAALIAAIPEVFPALDAMGLDYHLGVVSMDMVDAVDNRGQLRVVDGFNFVDPSTPDRSQVFTQMADVGNGGSYLTEGRGAAYTALEINRALPANAGFYRDEASLSLVFVSDSEDRSSFIPVDREAFFRWMRRLKADPSQVISSGFIYPPAGACPTANIRGLEYARYAYEQQGLILNICEDDWAPGLEQIFDRLLDTGRVQLPPASEVLSVEFIGAATMELSPEQYRYDPDSSAVYLDQGTRPAPGQSVRVEYALP